MDLSKLASYITLEPSQLFRAERFVEQGLKMYDADEELTEQYLKENLHGVTLEYAMHVLSESSTSYMDVAIHNQGGKFSAPTAGVYGVSSRPELKKKIKDKVLKRNELEKKQRAMKKEEVELDEAMSLDERVTRIGGEFKKPKPLGKLPKSSGPSGMEKLKKGRESYNKSRETASRNILRQTKEEVEVQESAEDRLRDQRMERGGVDGNTNYRRSPSTATGPKKKPSGNSMSAFDKVAGDLKKKYGAGAIYAKKTTKEEVVLEKKAAKDYDGDGKIESGSKEHAGVVHNAIQRAKGKKADGKDTRKEEVQLEGKKEPCGKCGKEHENVKHCCSKKVEHAEWGVGECMNEMHTLDENGNISHYDVLFAHGIEENVSVEVLTTLVSEMHEHAINTEKNEVVESMKQARKNVGASKCWKGYKAKGTKTKDGKVVPNCVKEDEEIEESNIEIKGKKKGNVIINPEVKKVTEDADANKKMQIQKRQLMLNKQKVALQQKATSQKKPTDMHTEETEDIQEVDMSTRSVDYGQEIEDTTLRRKTEKKSLKDFKKLSKPKKS